jgi:hypothetical protein
MPYFRRMPIEGIADAVLARATIPGLPSRGTALPAAIAAGALPTAPVATATGIVEQAAAVLFSEPSRIHPVPYGRRAANIDASPHSAWAGQLEAQVKTLVDQFVALAIQAPALDGAMPQGVPFAGSDRLTDTAQTGIDPAPVLSPPGPVAPGGTAQITIKLVNEDDQAAQIAFLNTDLVGEDGARIAAENLAFQPREVTLATNSSSVVVVRIAIPAQTRCGIYSGLVRASKLDDLHAVLKVQVEKTPA